MQQFELLKNEQIVYEVKGNYWKNSYIFLYDKMYGRIIVTNMRLIYEAKIFNKGYMAVSLNLQDIELVDKCNVGAVLPLNPTGIKVIMKNGRVFKFSTMYKEKLKKNIEDLINNK